MSRTKRHELTGAKRVSHSCRNHGSCPWCYRNRKYAELRELLRVDSELKDLENGKE